MSRATIVIIEHGQQLALGVPYMLHRIAQRWQRQGFEVLFHRGLGMPPAGDLAILHVDLTQVPDAYRALLAKYPKVLNSNVFNIAKSAYSELIVRKNSPWQGAVIVKTEANFGGQIDHCLHKLEGQTLTLPVLKKYPVYDSAAEVPPEVWTLPGLIVERFVPERDGEHYAIRLWTFFGAAERSSRYLGEHGILKASNMHSRSDVPVPEELRALRRKLGFDFGKFDYVYSEGRYWLLDANRTPGAPAVFNAQPETEAFLDRLASGLEAYLR